MNSQEPDSPRAALYGSYRFSIGLRYLIRGTRESKITSSLLFVGLLIAVVGGLLSWWSEGRSLVSIILISVGMVAALIGAMLRYLSVIVTVSCLGVVFGVAALVVVLAVGSGLEKEIRAKVVGVNAHLYVKPRTGSMADSGSNGWAAIAKIARNIDKNVVAVQPFLFVPVLASNQRGDVSGVQMKGVDPFAVSDVLDVDQYMLDGAKIAALDKPSNGFPTAVIGKGLAVDLGLERGDHIVLVGGDSRRDEEYRTQKFRVVGVFDSGFDEYDRRLIFCSLDAARDFSKQGVLGVELRVTSLDRASAVAAKLHAYLDAEYMSEPGGKSYYVVQDWYQLNRFLFSALALQKRVLFIILTIIIIVATINVVSALTNVVLDKTQQIAILKSMGARAREIFGIFAMVGGMVGVIGTVIGVGIGLALCQLIASYQFPLDPRVYRIDTLPISIHPWEVFLVAVMTVGIATAATLFPSAKASRLRPVQGLRQDEA